MRRLLPLALVLLPGCAPRPADAYAFCQRAVQEHLTAPGSAIFPKLGSDGLQVRGDAGAFEFTGYVDSQNQFGALLRTPFFCKAYHEDGAWHRVGLRLGDLHID